ncbi:hypothetical protein BDZ89DRAFT_226268 [Hymenopellis radicata]|nr:hypothetical protein BDZ89DRAFT_226268 [Hymenopellis radicata]
MAPGRELVGLTCHARDQQAHARIRSGQLVLHTNASPNNVSWGRAFPDFPRHTPTITKNGWSRRQCRDIRITVLVGTRLFDLSPSGNCQEPERPPLLQTLLHVFAGPHSVLPAGCCPRLLDVHSNRRSTRRLEASCIISLSFPGVDGGWC